MENKVLIINTSNKTPRFFVEIEEKLLRDGFSFYVYSSCERQLKFCKKNNVFSKKIKKTSFNFLNTRAINFFKLSKIFFILYRAKRKYGINKIILCTPEDKFFYTGLAVFLKIKCVWVELESINYKKYSKKAAEKIKKLAKKAVCVVFSEFSKDLAAAQGLTDSPAKVNVGIKPRDSAYQGNIFDSLAKREYNNVGKRYFVVGTIISLDEKNKIELLYNSIKHSLGFVKKIQLIIIGSGEYSPDRNPWAKWLAKKLGIDNLVWFINKSSNYKKWLEGFDVFLMPSTRHNYDDYRSLMLAMYNGLPVVAPNGLGYEEIISDSKNGCLYNHSAADMAEKIIYLHKNTRARKIISQQAPLIIESEHLISDTVGRLKKIIG